MHGAAITLARQALLAAQPYDLLLFSDMLDVNVFLSLTRSRYANTPTALYFHENQLSYPWSPRDADRGAQRDRHYAFINYASALAVDKLYFNSDYHRTSFLAALPDFLSAFPDFENKQTLSELAAKSATLPLGIDLSSYDAYAPSAPRPSKDVPLLLWNHRWEYDKDPQSFCQLLFELLDRHIDFEVALLGERFEQEPPYFAAARQRLGRRIRAYGRAESFEDYARWLWQADILPVTSSQDFFGGSVVEAVHCGCHPILPDRLAYPEHFDSKENPRYFYATPKEATQKLVSLIQSGDWKAPCPLRERAARYDWTRLAPTYDATLLPKP